MLDAACARAAGDWTFRIADVVAARPHLNPATIRTHVASRCCANAPAHHQSRYRYFKAIARGRYRIEPRYRRRPASRRAWTDLPLAALASGVDPTLIAESMAMTPTERLDVMQRAARQLDALRRR